MSGFLLLFLNKQKLQPYTTEVKRNRSRGPAAAGGQAAGRFRARLGRLC